MIIQPIDVVILGHWLDWKAFRQQKSFFRERPALRIRATFRTLSVASAVLQQRNWIRFVLKPGFVSKFSGRLPVTSRRCQGTTLPHIPVRICIASKISADQYRRYEHFSQVSTTEYFAQLLELQPINWLRLPLFQGMATSAVAGAEGLIRSTRSALIQYINNHPAEGHPEIANAIIDDLLLVLSEKLTDERYAIPILETAAFLLDSYVAPVPGFQSPTSVILTQHLPANY